VFAGGWTLEAAEAVCDFGLPILDLGLRQRSEGAPSSPFPLSQSKMDVLDLLTRLVDKSLVVVEEQPDGTARYRLLETLRQYGRGRLALSGQVDGVGQRHASYFLDLAKLLGEGVSAWRSPERPAWLHRLD